MVGWKYTEVGFWILPKNGFGTLATRLVPCDAQNEVGNWL